MIRIGINLLSESPLSAGIKVYAQNLLTSLAKIDNKNRYFIFVSYRNLETYYLKKNNIKYVSIRIPDKSAVTRRIVEQLLIPYLCRRYKVDVIHSVNNVTPFFSKTPSIVTILDVTSFKIKNRFGVLKRFYLMLSVLYTSRKANKIITISNNTAKEIMKYCNIGGEKINIIYPGVALSFNNTSKGNNDLIKKIVERPYLLYVGTLEPGKNIGRLIDAFIQSRPKLEKDYTLVIAGRKGWKYKDILQRIKKLEDKIFLTGYVPPALLPVLYKNASLFLFPSLHEGFGLPVVEAMACGVPVITSNITALPEVAGDAALLVDPYNTNSIAEGIQKVLTDRQLRETLMKRGFERVKLFSWEKCARETLKVYEEVYTEK